MRSDAGRATSRLMLADWRRQMATLYADVRRLSESDPAAALEEWRRVRQRLYREHPQSPLPPDRRADFVARHFPHDPALRFEVRVILDEEKEEGDASDSAGIGLRPFGWVTVPFPAGTRRLSLFWMEEYAGGLFLSFRDGTNGAETYGGGRYLLDGAKSADLGGDAARGTLILDFNFAYHPSCAFDPSWACPLAPRENWLDIAIRAGERLG